MKIHKMSNLGNSFLSFHFAPLVVPPEMPRAIALVPAGPSAAPEDVYSLDNLGSEWSWKTPSVHVMHGHLVLVSTQLKTI